MWWINIICIVILILVIFASMLCETLAMRNLDRIVQGLKPKYNPKKLSLWSNINLIIAIITLVITIINFLIYILFN